MKDLPLAIVLGGLLGVLHGLSQPSYSATPSFTRGTVTSETTTSQTKCTARQGSRYCTRSDRGSWICPRGQSRSDGLVSSVEMALFIHVSSCCVRCMKHTFGQSHIMRACNPRFVPLSMQRNICWTAARFRPRSSTLTLSSLKKRP